MVMGNVSGRKDEAEASGTKNEDDVEGEEYMEYAHGSAQLAGYQMHARFPESMAQSPPHSPRAYQSPLIFSSQSESDQTMRNQAINDQYGDMNTGNGIATIIAWNYGGNQVAIEGSWDNWKTREFLEKTGKEFTLVKLLPSGVYHYRFVADGHYRYDPDLPHEGDDRGNVFNVLDLQDQAPEIMDNIGMNEAPSSPLSSYSSIPFSLEDFNEKIPDLPPLLQKTPLDQASRSMESSIEALHKPLPAILNHLYIQTGESMVALGSTHRFRRKYVTTVLYKSSMNPKK